jgi:hypothetical protein
MKHHTAIRFLKMSVAVEHGFLAAGVVVAIAAALQSFGIVLGWFGL